MNNIAQGLLILLSYPGRHNLESERNEIFGEGPSPTGMIPKDASRMVELGWIYDNQLEFWRHHLDQYA